ncbi:MAG: monovalent cation/H+ antiporter subunit D [Burkholderiaceae bacterium]|nr:monovalent cation/H+ antiporter subunit D [Burkholderiaceae bacterium]
MIGWAKAAMPHLIVAPIVLPLATAALMLFASERRRRLRASLNVLSCAAALAVAIALLLVVDERSAAAVGVYLPANWPAPFGIVLALDRLSAMMLVVTGVIAFAAVVYSVARWDRAGVNFHPLFQLQLMGVNGAFLTVDVFNLFVFFEILLAASYGLLLHGSGASRVRAGLHYIAVNLFASSLFLVGVAVLYGAAGTLNLADFAARIPQVAAADRPLLHAGAAILAVAFLAKAAMWPLNFWLVPAYSAAGAPVAALFAILTKVGVYAILRIWTLFFGVDAGESAHFGGAALTWIGMTSLAVASIGMLASHHPGRLAAWGVVISSATLVAAIGFARPSLTAGALFYLIGSTFALAALVLLVELIDRAREVEPKVPLDDVDPLPFSVEYIERPDSNLDEDESVLIGRTIPGALAFLGLAFIVCALMIAGMPPLSGFLGKFAMLSSALAPQPELASDPLSAPGIAALAMVLVLIGSGFLSLVGLSRAGIRYFWAPQERAAPRLRVIETLPIAALLALCALLTIRAEPVMRYAADTARALHQPAAYVDAVLTARPVERQ